MNLVCKYHLLVIEWSPQGQECLQTQLGRQCLNERCRNVIQGVSGAQKVMIIIVPATSGLQRALLLWVKSDCYLSSLLLEFGRMHLNIKKLPVVLPSLRIIKAQQEADLINHCQSDRLLSCSFMEEWKQGRKFVAVKKFLEQWDL